MHWMNRRLGISLAVAFVAASTIVYGAASLNVVPLVTGNDVLVSVELTGAFTDDVRQAISSGLRTTFTYDIELRMAVPVWVDRTIATAVVGVSDQYDNLTRRHRLTRTLDGRVVDASVTEDEAVVRRWLTTLSRLPLSRTSALDANREYYVRISAHTRPQGTSLLGWATAITGQAKFTFIQ